MVEVNEDSLDLRILVNRDQRIYKKNNDYYFVDLSMVNSSACRGVINFCLEKAWRCLQHLIKVQANYTAMDTNILSNTIKSLADCKSKQVNIEALLTSEALQGVDLQRSGDVLKANLLMFVVAVMPYFLAVRMPGDLGSLKCLSLNRIYNTLAEMISKGKQYCSPAQAERNSREEIESFIKEEVQRLIGKLVEDSIELVIPFSALNKYATIRLNAEASMNALEDIFKERIEIKKLHKMYQMAVQFAQKNYRPPPKDIPYSLENECKIC